MARGAKKCKPVEENYDTDTESDNEDEAHCSRRMTNQVCTRTLEFLIKHEPSEEEFEFLKEVVGTYIKRTKSSLFESHSLSSACTNIMKSASKIIKERKKLKLKHNSHPILNPELILIPGFR